MKEKYRYKVVLKKSKGVETRPRVVFLFADVMHIQGGVLSFLNAAGIIRAYSAGCWESVELRGEADDKKDENEAKAKVVVPAPAL